MKLSCSKKLAALLWEKTSKHHGDFNCLNCFHSIATKNKRDSHKKIIMPSEDTKILQFNPYQKSDKATFVFYPYLTYSIEKIDGCKNSPENSSTTKVGKHISSGFSMSAKSSFKSIQNNHDVYRGKDCMKKFCESLREHANGDNYF